MVTKTYLKLTYLCDSIEISDCSDSIGRSDNSDSSDSSDSNDSSESDDSNESSDSSDQVTFSHTKNFHQKTFFFLHKKRVQPKQIMFTKKCFFNWNFVFFFFLQNKL